MFSIGINSNNQCGKDYKEVLNNIKNAGFDSVMVAFNLKDDEEMLKEASKLGLKIPFVHLDYKFGNDLWLKGATCDEYVNNVIKQIELCAKYNIHNVVFHATWGSPCDIPNKPNKVGLDNFMKLIEICKKEKIVISVENLDRNEYEHLEYLFNNVDSPNIGFCFDIGHHNLYTKDKEMLERFGDKLSAIHLHDNYCDWEEGYDFSRDMHLLPYDGKIDYEKYLKQIASTRYDDCIMLELHKSGLCVPHIYDKLTNEEYLKEAYSRAIKIKDKIENYRNK